MKNFYHFLLLLLTFLSYAVQAQIPHKGYIVNLKKDTIQGYIIDKTDHDLSSKIEFKKESKDGNLIQYSIKDLLGFGFNYGRVFERMAFRDSLNDSVKVFAKKILDGKIRLFVWRKNTWDKFDFFLFNRDPVRVVHLTEPTKRVIKEDNGKEYAVEKSNYMGLLKYVKNDSVSHVAKEKKIKYSEKEIIQ